MKKIIIVSAVNIVEGGTLAVLKECLEYLSANLSDEYRIIILIHRRELFAIKNLKYIEFPASKKHWINRLYYEYYYFSKLSRRLNPYLWLCFHDMTPNVSTERLAVYCHNPSPFPPLELKDFRWGGYKFILFKLFYRYLYAYNIHKSDFVILQQKCLKKKFIEITGVDPGKIIVAHPDMSIRKITIRPFENKNIFFYPSFPRVFKNLEIIGSASRILLKQGIDNFRVIFTISGNENSYARYIYRSFKGVKNIEFIGLQNRDRVFELYNSATCIIFPSKLETWGMPIIESKLFQKPILLADLEYAHETLGTYDRVKFFNPDNAKQLADLMKAVIAGTIVYDTAEYNIKTERFSKNWRELLDILLNSDLSSLSRGSAGTERMTNA